MTELHEPLVHGSTQPGKRFCRGKLSGSAFGLLLVSAVAISFAIAAAVIFLGVIPHQVSQNINESSLDFHSINMYRPTNDSVSIFLNGTVKSSSPRKAFLHENIMKVFYGNLEMGSIPMPELMIRGNTPFTHSTSFHISDLDVFSKFGKDLVASEAIEWTIQANVAVTPVWGILGNLTTIHNIPFNKTLKISGMGGFQQVNINSFTLAQSNETAVVVDANVHLFNPSSFTFDTMGRLFFNMHYKNHYMGCLMTRSSQLNRGSNVLELSGVFKPKDQNVASELLNQYFSNKNCLLEVRAAAPFSSVAIYAQGLSATTLNAVLRGTTQQLVKNMNIVSLDLEGADDSHAAIKSNIYAEIDQSILGQDTPLSVMEAGVDISMSLPQLGLLASIAMDSVNVSMLDRPGCFSLPLQARAFLPARGTPLAQFFQFLSMYNSNVTVNLKGTFTAKIKTIAGTFLLQDIPIDLDTALSGMNGLRSTLPYFEVSDSDISPTGVETSLSFTVTNPSQISFPLGTTYLSLARHADVPFRFGRIRIDDFTISPGTQTYTASGYLTNETVPSGGDRHSTLKDLGQHLTQAIQGKDSPLFIEITDFSIGASATWLENSYKQLAFVVKSPRSVEGPSSLLDLNGQVYVDVANNALTVPLRTNLHTPQWAAFAISNFHVPNAHFAFNFLNCNIAANLTNVMTTSMPSFVSDASSDRIYPVNSIANIVGLATDIANSFLEYSLSEENLDFLLHWAPQYEVKSRLGVLPLMLNHSEQRTNVSVSGLKNVARATLPLTVLGHSARVSTNLVALPVNMSVPFNLRNTIVLDLGRQTLPFGDGAALLLPNFVLGGTAATHKMPCWLQLSPGSGQGDRIVGALMSGRTTISTSTGGVLPEISVNTTAMPSFISAISVNSTVIQGIIDGKISHFDLSLSMRNRFNGVGLEISLQDSASLSLHFHHIPFATVSTMQQTFSTSETKNIAVIATVVHRDAEFWKDVRSRLENNTWNVNLSAHINAQIYVPGSTSSVTFAITYDPVDVPVHSEYKNAII